MRTAIELATSVTLQITMTTDKPVRLLFFHTLDQGWRSRGEYPKIADAKQVCNCNIVECCLRENSPSAWARLFCFATKIFALSHSTEDRKVSFTTAVKSNITPFEKNRSPSTISETTNRKAKNLSTVPKSQVNTRLDDGDIGGAIRFPTNDDSIAPFDGNTMLTLQERQPQANVDTLYTSLPDFTVEHPMVAPEEIKAAKRSFWNGSTAGVDHLRAQNITHMIDMTDFDSSTKVISALAELLQLTLLRLTYASKFALSFTAPHLLHSKRKMGAYV